MYKFLYIQHTSASAVWCCLLDDMQQHKHSCARCGLHVVMVPEDSQYLQHTEVGFWNGVKRGFKKNFLPKTIDGRYIQFQDDLIKSGVQMKDDRLGNFFVELYAAVDEYRLSHDFAVVGGKLFAKSRQFVSECDKKDQENVKRIAGKCMRSVMLSAGVPENIYETVFKQVKYQ